MAMLPLGGRGAEDEGGGGGPDEAEEEGDGKWAKWDCGQGRANVEGGLDWGWGCWGCGVNGVEGLGLGLGLGEGGIGVGVEGAVEEGGGS